MRDHKMILVVEEERLAAIARAERAEARVTECLEANGALINSKDEMERCWKEAHTRVTELEAVNRGLDAGAKSHLNVIANLRARAERAEARVAEVEIASKELHKCLAAMVDRWEPDTEGLDRVMWENACEALGRDIWAHLRTT